MKPILEIDSISKKYLIQKSGQQPYLSLRDSVSTFFKKKDKEEFWALKDISFQVQPGESIGIIGKNGAGKSTLLKILSQITPPTTGRITARGRIASLLEVGTGFHAELTGRENIFMNGSILGMKRAEILRNFDAIVDFSGVEQFLDTPLKHYSSGMQLRLAFAVAAFLENEILIIDEVLAVGDAEFQKKCLGKMNEVSKSGRSILFVSHDLDSVANLCDNGIYLKKGGIAHSGNISDVLHSYSKNYGSSSQKWELNQRPGNEKVRLNGVSLVNEQKEQIHQPTIHEKVGVRIEYELFEDNFSPSPNVHFFNTNNTCCFLGISGAKTTEKGTYEVIIWIPANTMNNIQYTIGVSITTLKTVEVHLDMRDIINVDFFEDKFKRITDFSGVIPGVVRPTSVSELKKIK
jgi:lipopolysaccharide transport system ATP-binding protein